MTTKTCIGDGSSRYIFLILLAFVCFTIIEGVSLGVFLAKNEKKKQQSEVESTFFLVPTLHKIMNHSNLHIQDVFGCRHV